MRMLSVCCLALLACGAIDFASAEDTIQLSPAATRYQQLVKDFKQANEEFGAAYAAAKTDEERKQVETRLGPKAVPDHYTGQFAELVREYPKDPVSLNALRWMFLRVPYRAETTEMVDVLLPIWAEDDRIGPVLQTLSYSSCPAGDKLLRAVLEKNRHRELQGLACFGLGVSLRSQADRLPPTDVDARRKFEGKAEQMFERVAADYAEVEQLGQKASSELYALRNLAIGKTAPEIAGEAIDGQPLKLSEFRGKVVLLVFWASWCGPCMADVPHERELAERYQGQPFAIVGVCGDQDREAARAAVAKSEIGWRSFWHAEGSRGPIPKQWNVDSWPTLYLIDAQGVIRNKSPYLRRQLFRKDEHGNQQSVYMLDEAVATLMKEATGQKVD